MKRFIIAGNWKMNVPPSLDKYADTLTRAMRELRVSATQAEVVLCPPSLYTANVTSLCGKQISVGAQDISAFTSGAFTGEISAAMLADFDVKYALVGHSERRAKHAETDELVNRKAHAALAGGLFPIICVGETLTERQDGKTREVLQRQTAEAIRGMTVEDLGRVVFAYEPVWAIGTGLAATANDAAVGAEAIFGASDVIAAAGCLILYGGSVTEENAESLLRVPELCGLLVGGKSLDADAFAQIVAAAQKISDLGGK